MQTFERALNLSNQVTATPNLATDPNLQVIVGAFEVNNGGRNPIPRTE